MTVKDKSINFSIIDKDLTVEGTISCKGRLIIKGIVRGTLAGETVIIAREGAVYANIRVANLTIAGTCEGDIDASEALVILSTGTCTGRVSCKDLVVEANGILDAEVSCITPQGADLKDHLLKENQP